MNKNNIIKSTRKIKTFDNPKKKDDLFLHPLTLDLIKSKKDYTPSELYYIDGKPSFDKKTKSGNVYSDAEIQKFMTLPYLNLNNSIILYFYNIDNIEDLIEFIKNKINVNAPQKYIIRIINVFIKHNFDDLKINNGILLKIIKLINDKYWNLNYNDNDINKYLIKWFKTKDSIDFRFNLLKDINKYLKNNKK
jgi:hypothetical protein